MTPDEARKLVGGYATGSLTESERRLLFEAALEDQDLFDELAREDEFKQLLEEPGARDRLIAAVSPDDAKVAPRRPIWIWSGIAVAAVAFAAITWTALRPPKPMQIAQVEQKAAPTASPVAADQVQPSREVKPAAPGNRPAADKKEKVAPAAPATQAPAEAVAKDAAEKKKEERDASLDAAKPVVAGGAPAAPKQEAQQQAASQATAPPPAAAQSAPQQAPVQQNSQQVVEDSAQSRLLPAAPQAGRRAGGVGGRVSAFGKTATRKAARFAFDYTVQPEFLTLKFAADGWFSLHFSPGDDTIALAHVIAGQVRREAIPNNATEAAIVFAVEAQTDPSLGIQLTRSDKSGTVEDASGSRIEFLLKFY